MMNSPVLPDDYSMRVYAGVLGKIIGVYLGRPFEQWPYEKIESTFGDINGYVHEQVGAPLIVTDDDITGTFTFIRALDDNAATSGASSQITAEQIGWNWLNYIIENPHDSVVGRFGLRRRTHGVFAIEKRNYGAAERFD